MAGSCCSLTWRLPKSVFLAGFRRVVCLESWMTVENKVSMYVEAVCGRVDVASVAESVG